MELTEANKKHIDGLSYCGLLEHSRYAPIGDPWFEGETGKYWVRRVAEKRDENPTGAVADSKAIGWDGP